MKREIKIKNAFELKSLIDNLKNGEIDAEKEIYNYFDLIHNALMNYEGLIQQISGSIIEHSQNITRS